MRLILLVATTVICSTGLAAAQGTKDPANYGTVSNSRPQAASEPSRPTAIRNIPNNALPAGTSIQRVYRDGKLHSIAR